ncbi:MAG TPA: type II CRISPR RNA-guided endonuclease Cas9 [Candidatus Hydrogenedentes bacterium]|nr:type II CRISPR RNA-guided endonuclease Cas9 [Candidatus Hydrogenedentota bacterium]
MSIEETVLGLDLGVNSIGWGLLRCEDGMCKSIIRTGVRIFEAGMDGEVEQGKEESRNKKRRDARSQRRQIDRRLRRHKRLARLLQKNGMLPSGDLKSGQGRHELLLRLDRDIFRKYETEIEAENKHHFANTLPYWLRARALTQPLERHELGRVIYHLGQRRGFLSNRKAPRKDEDRSVVYEGIVRLHDSMRETNSKTLGEYFAGVDPTNPEESRIRNRWTHRDMYKKEFEALWEAQRTHHEGLLNDGLKKAIEKVMFDQRPLKIQKELIGKCQFENFAHGAKRERRRAPWGLLSSQRFRLLQTVNDLWMEDRDRNHIPLTEEQRQLLIDTLETQGDMTFPEVRTLLGLKRTTRFSLERGGEKKLPGNRTNAALRIIFGDRWDTLPTDEKKQVVEDLRSIEKARILAQRGINVWGLSEDKAHQFSQIELEPDYCNLSRLAIEKLLPLMEQGMALQTAVKQVYGTEIQADGEDIPVWSAVDALPPVIQAPLGELRNPTVFRILNELRKVVNAIIRQYGKPDKIRIELARDVKRTKKERQRIWRANRDRERSRERAKARILEEMGNSKPSRDDIEKVLLAEECGWECPYTGKRINMASLLGESAQFDVEHIIPLSMSLDNSFNNKTLCYLEENRSVKKKRTPYEAYSSDSDGWQQIISRVKKFSGESMEAKLRRFMLHGDELKAFLEGFVSSQLNDTRYASRLAAQYCGLLYGGEFRKHVQVSKGVITAELRKAWQLNSVLGNGGSIKSRDDHRHHAIDAIAIGLSCPSMVKKVTELAYQAEQQGHYRWWKLIPPPWEGFLEEVKKSIEAIVVSHKTKRSVNGAFHKATLYSPPKKDTEGKLCVHIRKKINDLSKTEINKIVDPIIRQCVQDKLVEIGINDPKKAFAIWTNHPQMLSKKKQPIPIHKVRIIDRDPVFKIGEKERERFVSTDTNHHIEIFEKESSSGSKQWEGRVVSLFEVIRRKANRNNTIQKEYIKGYRFIFSLSPGDMVEMEDSSGTRELFVVCGISQYSSGQVNLDFKQHNDARPISQISRQGRTRTPDTMRKSGIKKTTVTVLGDIRWAND